MKTSKAKRIIKATIPFVVLFGLLVWPIAEYNKSTAQIPVTDVAASGSLSSINMNLAKQGMTSSEIAATQMDMAGVQSEMSSVQSQMSSMTKAMKEKQEAMEKADKMVSYVEDLKTLKQVSQSFASLLCTYQSLNLMLQKNGSLSICHVNAHYSLAIIDIQGAVDLVKLVMKGGLKMDQGVRISNLKQAIDLLGRGHSKMMTLSHSMNVSNVRKQNNANYWAAQRNTLGIYKY